MFTTFYSLEIFVRGSFSLCGNSCQGLYEASEPMIKGLFDNTIFIEICFLGKIIATLIGFF